MKFTLAFGVFLWAGLVAPLWFLIPFSIFVVLVTPFKEISIFPFFIAIIMSSPSLWYQISCMILIIGIFYGILSIKNSLKIPQLIA